MISLTQDNTEHSFTEDVFCLFHQDVKCPIEPRQIFIKIKWKKLEKEGRPGSSERRIRKMFTFDVVLFDCRAAVGWFFDVGTVALLVDDAPAWNKQNDDICFQLKYKKTMTSYWKSSSLPA